MSTTTREGPPHNDYAERAVCAAMLMARSVKLVETIDRVAAIMDPGNCYSDRHAAICRAVLELHAEGVAVDVVTVGDRLERWGKLEACGGHGYLLELLQAVPHVADAEYYAGIVRERACERQAMVAGSELARVMADPSATPEAKQRTLAAVANLTVGGDARRSVTLEDIWGEIDPRNLEPLRVFKIGEIFGLVELYPGKIVAVAAGPGTGKTALMAQWTVDAMIADPSLTALIANVEMSPRELIFRQLSRLGGIPLSKVMHRSPILKHGDDSERLDYALDRLSGIRGRLHFARDPHSIEAIHADVRRIRPDIVVLDYIQKIRTSNTRSDTRERIDEVMTTARKMAFSGACVLAASAVSRQKTANGSGYRNLSMANLRDSSTLEFDADDVWLMEEDDPDPDARPDPEIPKRINLWSDKTRNGQRSRMEIGLVGMYQRFVGIDEREVAI